MRTQHLQSIRQFSASVRGQEQRWLRYLSLAAALVLLVLTSARVEAEPIPSGRQRLTAPDPAPGKTFGDAIAVDGDTAVIGAPFDGTQAVNAGAAYVFIRVNGAWVPHPTTPKLLGSTSAAGDQFGSAVAISGQSIVIGAVARNFEAGAAYAFRRASSAVTGSWAQEQNITPGGLSPQDQFGTSVSISGTTVVVGAPGDTGNAGAAYVFVRSSSSPPWAQQAGKLLPGSRVASATFGSSVAFAGETAIIGAPGQTDEGAAFVFRRAGTSWSSGQALSVAAPLPSLQNGDAFGTSVAVSSNGLWVLVGAPGADVGNVMEAGAVYFFERVGAFVGRQRFDTPTPLDTGEFGRSVVIAGTVAAVSGPQELSERGQVHLFSLSASNSWARAQARLSSGLDEIAGFGRALALSAGSAFIGASQEPCGPVDCGAEGSVYAYAILDVGATVPLLPGWPLYALGAALAASAVWLSHRQRAYARR